MTILFGKKVLEVQFASKWMSERETKFIYLRDGIDDDGGEDGSDDLDSAPDDVVHDPHAHVIGRGLEDHDHHGDQAHHQRVEHHGLVVLQVPHLHDGQQQNGEHAAHLEAVTMLSQVRAATVVHLFT